MLADVFNSVEDILKNVKSSALNNLEGSSSKHAWMRVPYSLPAFVSVKSNAGRNTTKLSGTWS